MNFTIFDGGDARTDLLTLASINAELDKIAARERDVLDLANAFGLSFNSAKELSRSLKLSTAEIRKAATIMRQLRRAGADTSEAFTLLTRELSLSIEQLEELDETLGNLEDQTDTVADLRDALSNLFVLDRLLAFKDEVIQTGLVFERLQTQLETTLGTDLAADAAFARIQEFAANTPFQVTEVTDAFVKLQNRGIKPTNENLQRLGDLASSQAKSLDQATEAVLDASQGQFERLREFGINASAAGDRVNITFKGITTQVERTEQAISEGIFALGDFEGVAGGMAAQAETLGGQLSNLQDNTEALSNEAFELVQGPAVAIVRTANAIISVFFELNPNIQRLILGTTALGTVFASAVVALAAFRAANIGAAASTVASTAAQLPNTVATIANTAAKTALNLVEATGESLRAKGIITTNAQTAATVANTAATKAASTGILGQAAALGAVAGVAAAATAAVALAVDSFLAVDRGARTAIEGIEATEEALKAFEAAQEKRREANEATAKSEAELRKRQDESRQSLQERSEQLANEDLEIQQEFSEQIQKDIGVFQRYLDIVRQFSSVGGILELISELEFIPEPVANLIEKVANLLPQLTTAAEAAEEKAKLSFNELLDSANEVSAGFQDIRIDGFANVDIAEVERLQEAYEANLTALEATVPADAEAAQSKELYIRTLQREKAELDDVFKALDEQRKRVVALGDAQTQYGAIVEKSLEKVRKQIATDDDAQKIIDSTNKQLEAGVITSEQAISQLQEVADYRSINADLQIAAIDAIRQAEIEASNAKLTALGAERIRLQALGLAELATREETALALEEVGLREIEARREQQEAILEIERSNGRNRSRAAVEAEAELTKIGAEAEVQRQNIRQAAADSALADLKRANQEANAAIQEAQAGLQAQNARLELAAVTQGVEDVQAVRAIGIQRELEQKRRATQQLIDLQQSEIEAVQAKIDEGIILEKEGTKQLIALRTGLSELQQDLISNDLEAFRNAEEERLRIIGESVAEEARLRGIQNDNDEAAQLAEQVAAIRAGAQSVEAAERELSEFRRQQDQANVDSGLAALDQEQANLDNALAEGIISYEAYKNEVDRIDAERSSLLRDRQAAELEEFKAQQDEAIRIYTEAAEDRTNAIDDAALVFDIEQGEREVAALSDFTTDVDDLEEQLAEARRDRLAEDRAARRASFQQELDDVNEKFSQQVLDEEVYASEVRRITNEINNIRKEELDAENELLREIRQKRVEAIDEYKTAFENAGNSIVTVLSQVSSELEQQNSLLNAQTSLQSALARSQDLTIDFALEELGYQKQLAEQAGNKASAARLEEQINLRKLEQLQLERQRIIDGAEAKRLSLQISQEQRDIQLEQNRLTAELALLETQANLAQAEADGASAKELNALRDQIALREAAVQLSDRAIINQEKINDLVEQEAEVTRQNDLRQNANQQRIIERNLGRSSTAESRAVRNAQVQDVESVVDLGAIREAVNTSVAEGAADVEVRQTALAAAQDQFLQSLENSEGGLDSFIRVTEAIQEIDPNAIRANLEALAATPRAQPTARRAMGGRVKPGQATWVGEKGPELMFFDQGGYVVDSARSFRMMQKIQSAAIQQIGNMTAASPVVTNNSSSSSSSIDSSITRNESLQVTFGSPDEPQFQHWLKLRRTLNRLNARRK